MELRQDLINSLNKTYDTIKKLKDKELIKVHYEVAMAIEYMLGEVESEELTVSLAD